MISLQEMRETLGPYASEMTDEHLYELREEMYRIAKVGLKEYKIAVRAGIKNAQPFRVEQKIQSDN